MEVTKGQYQDILKAFGFIPKEHCTVIFEGGSDNGDTFNGSFLVKIKSKGVFRFDDGSLSKRVK